MRIYNGTSSQLNLPYVGNERITIPPMSPSGNIMCSSEFLSLLITSYDTDEVAIIVSGPFEINACATVPAAVNYVVQSLDEAIQRFAIPTTEETAKPVVEDEVKVVSHVETEPVVEEKKAEVVEEKVTDETIEEEKTEEKVEETLVDSTPKKKSGKKYKK